MDCNKKKPRLSPARIRLIAILCFFAGLLCFTISEGCNISLESGNKAVISDFTALILVCIGFLLALLAAVINIVACFRNAPLPKIFKCRGRDEADKQPKTLAKPHIMN